MKVIKITNPLWLGQIGPKLDAFVKKISVQGIGYESFYSYIVNAIQFGGNLSEFWVAMDKNKPVAFAHWLVRGLPHVGTVYCDFIHSWTKDQKAISLLLDEFARFGEKNHAPLYEGDTINETIYRLFRKLVGEKGYDIEKSGVINFIGRKRPKGDTG